MPTGGLTTQRAALAARQLRCRSLPLSVNLSAFGTGMLLQRAELRERTCEREAHNKGYRDCDHNVCNGVPGVVVLIGLLHRPELIGFLHSGVRLAHSGRHCTVRKRQIESG